MPRNEKSAAIIGRVIRDVREELEVTQQQVALKASMDRAYLSEVENGKRSLSLDRFIKICATLGVTASSVLDRIEKRLKR